MVQRIHTHSDKLLLLNPKVATSNFHTKAPKQLIISTEVITIHTNENTSPSHRNHFNK